MWAHHKREITNVLSLAPGSVYWWRKSKTAGGDVYCTADVGTTGTEGGREGGCEMGGLTKEKRKGDKQTDRMKETEKDHSKLSDGNSLWGRI